MFLSGSKSKLNLFGEAPVGQHTLENGEYEMFSRCDLSASCWARLLTLNS